jgi:hypothetical protein
MIENDEILFDFIKDCFYSNDELCNDDFLSSNHNDHDILTNINWKKNNDNDNNDINNNNNHCIISNSNSTIINHDNKPNQENIIIPPFNFMNDTNELFLQFKGLENNYDLDRIVNDALIYNNDDAKIDTAIHDFFKTSQIPLLKFFINFNNKNYSETPPDGLCAYHVMYKVRKEPEPVPEINNGLDLINYTTKVLEGVKEEDKIITHKFNIKLNLKTFVADSILPKNQKKKKNQK